MKGSPFDLTGKVALVTGAVGLIGREHCIALAEAGATVVALDLDGVNCRALAHTLPDPTGHGHDGLGGDITLPDDVLRIRDRVLEDRGTIDILVNNAAINDAFESPAAAAEQSRFENYPLSLWQRSMDVNVTGTFICSQVFGSVMSQQRSGSIINIASTYGLVGPDQSLYRKDDGTQTFYKTAAYPVTKGAVLAFTRFLAAYWGEAGVRVNALSPGGVQNGQEEWFVKRYAGRTPLGRMASPSEYRGAVVFLASDASGYMTGANLVIDGGWTAW
jgi:NAD(P)-dependent dehydrogenase (short-subunit alcohol dehydrogenase family)